MTLKMNTACAALISLLVVSLGVVPLATADDNFCFGIWGDMPYASNSDITDAIDKAANVVASMNENDLAFSIFNGDIKDGGSPCGYVNGTATDDYGVYSYAFNLFESSTAPVIYTPGDNEWTDCHRESNDNNSASPLAMLDFIRETFFSDVTIYNKSFPLGGTEDNTFKIRHQEGLVVENTRWIYGDVVFLTLHVVGTNNNNAVTEGEAGDSCGRDDVDSCADQVLEYEERTEYNLEWMAKTFDWAERQGAKGVVITWHANPGFDIQDTYDIVESEIGAHDGSNGFSSTLEALWGHTKDFDGEVSGEFIEKIFKDLVLLLHGDSHNYRADQPFAASDWLQPLNSAVPALDNFMRIMAPGSPTINWAQICVNPDAPALFSQRVVIVEANHNQDYW